MFFRYFMMYCFFCGAKIHLFRRGGQEFFGEAADEAVDFVAFVETGDVRGAEPQDYGGGEGNCRDDERDLPAEAFFLENQLFERCGIADSPVDFWRGAFCCYAFPETAAAMGCDTPAQSCEAAARSCDAAARAEPSGCIAILILGAFWSATASTQDLGDVVDDLAEGVDVAAFIEESSGHLFRCRVGLRAGRHL